MSEQRSSIKKTLRGIAGGALLGAALGLAAALRSLIRHEHTSETAVPAEVRPERAPDTDRGTADAAAAERPAAPPRPGWQPVAREPPPHPTYWPAALAFGITLVAWGIATTYIISAIGALILLVSLLGWIGDLLHEH